MHKTRKVETTEMCINRWTGKQKKMKEKNKQNRKSVEKKKEIITQLNETETKNNRKYLKLRSGSLEKQYFQKVAFQNILKLKLSSFISTTPA